MRGLSPTVSFFVQGDDLYDVFDGVGVRIRLDADDNP